MSKYIPPSKRNIPDSNKQTNRKSKYNNQHNYHNNDKNDKTEKIVSSVPKVNNYEEFPPLPIPNTSEKKVSQTGAWSSKITISKEPISKPKVRLSTYYPSHDISCKTKEIIKKDAKKDDYVEYDDYDEFINDKHVYLNEDAYYSSD